MKIFAISVLGLLVVLAVIGCSPLGMDKTRVYVTGYVYTDPTESTPAEGIGIATVGVVAQESHVTETDSNGRYWMEIQFYPEIGTEEGGSSGSVTFGLYAFDNLGNEYYYGGDKEFTFTVFGGDTLSMYSINTEMIASSKSGGR
ncbi:MAG: hypothetical protein KAT09_03385 [Candidatus Aegiribacteria sp.]|nr:hypothetical protein [Candidatus Aegiribacteria sp.]